MAARLNPLMAVPPLLFAGFAAIAWVGLTRENPDELPSALIAQAAPSLDRLEPLGDLARPSQTDLDAPGVKLVNFWASWCGPCRAEHPFLTDLAAEGVPVIGVNYKDAEANALGFLDELGDPYTSTGADDSGRTGLDWGIYGVPETFVIGADGTIVARHPGPISRDVLENRLRPAMAAAE